MNIAFNILDYAVTNYKAILWQLYEIQCFEICLFHCIRFNITTKIWPSSIKKTSKKRTESVSKPIINYLKQMNCITSYLTFALWLWTISSHPQAFGFLNFFLWAGNIWFAYKETGLHKSGQRYPSRTPSEKRSDSFRQYSQSSFDQSGTGFGQRLYNQPSFDLSGGGLNLLQTNLGQPNVYRQMGSPTSRGPLIFVNESQWDKWMQCGYTV